MINNNSRSEGYMNATLCFQQQALILIVLQGHVCAHVWQLNLQAVSSTTYDQAQI